MTHFPDKQNVRKSLPSNPTTVVTPRRKLSLPVLPIPGQSLATSSLSPRNWGKKKSPKEEGKAGEERPLIVEVLVKPLAEKLIPIAISTYEAYKKGVYAEIKVKTVERLLELSDPAQVVEAVLSESLKNHSTITKRVEFIWARLKMAGGNEYLKGFVELHDPRAFWLRYHALDRMKKAILTEYIGGKQSKQILTYAGHQKMERKFKTECLAYVSALSEVESRILHIRNACFVFHKGFDRHCLSERTLPICLIQHDAILETLLPLWQEDLKRTTLLFIQEHSLALPSNGKEKEDGFFLEWVLRQFQDEMGLPEAACLEEQLKAFFTPIPISEKDLQELKKFAVQALKSLQDEERIDLSKFKMDYYNATGYSPSEAVVRFHQSLTYHREFFSSYLPTLKSYQEKDWETVAEILVDRLYLTMFQYDRANMVIQTLSILKALSHPAFETVMEFLKITLCPNLLIGETNSLQPSKALPVLHISKVEGHLFTVRHARRFMIYSLQSKEKQIGELVAQWTVQGSLSSAEYSAELEFPELYFFEGVTLREQKKTMEAFNLDWSKTPWEEFLTIVSKKGEK